MTFKMKTERHGNKQVFQRCQVWLHDQTIHEDARDDGDPLSDPLQESLPYSADEDISNHSQLDKRHKRNGNLESDLSEFSEISQEPQRPKHVQEDMEVDTSVISDDASEVTAKKPLTLREETLHLRCGWKACDYSTTKIEPFVNHVASHVPELEIKSSEEDNEDVYACLWESCSFETPNPDEITRHVNFHSYHTKAKCVGSLIFKNWKLPECSYGAAGVNLVPDLPKSLDCLWNDCTLTTNNPNIFYGHVGLHSGEIPASATKKGVMYKCLWKGCKSEVPNKNRMFEHLRVHSKERVCACPTCGVLYSSRMRLIDHIKRQAPEESLTYQCTHCSRSYPSERILRDHMRHHVNHYKCHFCDMTCPTPHSLSHHIRHRHIDEKPFSCQYCDYKSKTQYNMKRHMTTHTAADNFFCDEEECGYSCRTVNMLNWHYRKKHESKCVYCCHMCDSRFKRGAYLTRHLMKKHNFRWPSGHTRFRFYKNHEDGLFRLQTVRYESLDVFEDISRADVPQQSAPQGQKKFNISKSNGSNEINFLVTESDDDPDEPDNPMEESCENDSALSRGKDTSANGFLSMPSLDFDSPKKILISIDEVDGDGNIISSETVEAKELTDIGDIDMSKVQVVADGSHMF